MPDEDWLSPKEQAEADAARASAEIAEVRRFAWIRFVAAAMSSGRNETANARDAAVMADRLLIEFDKRNFIMK